MRRTNPAVLNYLAAENNYTAAAMAPTQALQDQLYAELTGRIPKADTPEPPQQENGYWYYSYRVPSGQYLIHARYGGLLRSANAQSMVSVDEALCIQRCTIRPSLHAAC